MPSSALQPYVCSILPPLMLIKRQGGNGEISGSLPTPHKGSKAREVKSWEESDNPKKILLRRKHGSLSWELPDSSCGGRENSVFPFPKGKHGWRLPGKHIRAALLSPWALRGKTPELHTASAPAAPHQLRRTAAPLLHLFYIQQED